MRSALTFLACLLALDAGPARADDGTAYARALHKGRKLEAKGDHLGALKAYDEALAAQPNDAAALSEVSVSALAAGDLARARDAATRAAKGDAYPRLQAAAYFNLGQVEEKAKDAGKAIAAYRAAMDACPNLGARARLAKLAPKVVAELMSFEAARPDGPYKTIALALAASRCEVEAGNSDGKASDAAPRGPWLAVRNVTCATRSAEKDPGTLGVALQVKSGWYVVREAKEIDAAARNDGSFDLSHDWPRLGPVLEWRGVADHHHVSHSRAGAEVESYTATSLLVCVVDRAGLPACLPALRTEGSEFLGTNDFDGTNEDKVNSDVQTDTHWALELKYVDGAVEISGAGDCTELPGRHPVVLP